MPRKSETTREGNRPNNGSHVRLFNPDRVIFVKKKKKYVTMLIRLFHFDFFVTLLFIVFAVYDGCI